MKLQRFETDLNLHAPCAHRGNQTRAATIAGDKTSTTLNSKIKRYKFLQLSQADLDKKEDQEALLTIFYF